MRHKRLRLAFSTHGADGIGCRADENDAGRGAGFGETGILREKTVTRMNGLRAACLCGGNDLFSIEIRRTSGCRADGDGLVGQRHVHGVAVGIRIDRDGADAHLAGGADDPAGDFAAVGDQYF